MLDLIAGEVRATEFIIEVREIKELNICGKFGPSRRLHARIKFVVKDLATGEVVTESGQWVADGDSMHSESGPPPPHYGYIMDPRIGVKLR